LIEQSEKPCVFIGKPCDTAAVSLLRRKRPTLDEKLGLVLTFFCAGTPSTQGTLDLLERLAIPREEVRQIRYRGYGWPGKFSVTMTGITASRKELAYHEAWSLLQKYRPYRCHLCPDSTGEYADIACGDPWYREIKTNEKGHSLILVRTQKGRKILNDAMIRGYIHAEQVDASILNKSQPNLFSKRAAVWGRIIAFRLMGLPAPRYVGFHLFNNWLTLPISVKVRSVAGTVKRIIERRYWKPMRLSD
jgi:coenzyme F420 hydrogenase subunit beta